VRKGGLFTGEKSGRSKTGKGKKMRGIRIESRYETKSVDYLVEMARKTPTLAK